MTLPQARRVVVTGLGATTPVGGDVASTWAAMLAGTSGVGVLTEDWAGQLPVRIAARAAVEPLETLSRVEARRLDRSGQFALVAAREAWADAQRDAPFTDLDPERVGAVVASGIGGVTTLLDSYDVLREKGARYVSPYAVPMLMPNGPAAAVGLEVGAKAGVHAPASACASGAEGIAFGTRMIREGKADVVICGGTEAAIHALPMAAFAAMKALSKREDEPQRASRPYDKGRDGFVMGEGAGLVVLEAAEHAERRGARAYAVIAGTGITSDAHHMAQPDPVGAGAARAMRFALEESGFSAADIVHVNAHATSTPQGDVAEVRALHAALGDEAASRVVVSATKSMTGHLLGAAGSVEAIAVILALRDRLAPPTINLDDPDDDVDLDVARFEPRPLPSGQVAAINNAFGFGGHNAALVIASTS